MKTITYSLILSREFPSWHLYKGQPTKFKEMLRIIKLHTIRSNYALWKKRFKKILLGEAELAIKEWTGRPYRSKTMEICRLTKDCGIGLQQLTFGKGIYGLTSLCRPIVDGKEVRAELLVHNDGLSFEEWSTWLANYDLSQPLAVIHFTSFRY